MVRDLLKLALIVAAAIPAAEAAETIDVERVITCSREADDARRLACYDSAVVNVTSAPASQSAHAAPAPTPLPRPIDKPAIKPATPDEFGVQGSAVARQRDVEHEQSGGKQELRSLSARVTTVTSRPRGELEITLDNGQVWLQKRAESYFPIRSGDDVTINAGVLGSYRLVNGKRSTQVTRIK